LARFLLPYHETLLFGELNMAIVIKDVSMTEELDRKAQTAVRGGDSLLLVGPPIWERYFPVGFPSPIPFPVGCPGEGGPKPFDPALLQTARS
jgi:hypothetical protein